MLKTYLFSSVPAMLGLAVALTVSGGANLAIAQESGIALRDGRSLTINEYLMETAANGDKTLVIRAVPDFDPEPFGQVPSDNYARLVQPLCSNLVANNGATLKEDNIGAVRVRWDFAPSKPDKDLPENMTITRFHEMVFDIANNAPCTPKPLGVGMDNLSPEVSADLEPTLRWAEPGLNPGELALTYAVETGLEAISISALERAAIELCILHADILLASRARYYAQLDSRTVAITFEQNDSKPGFELLRRVVFPVQDGHCATGLSKMLTEVIRNK